MYSRDAVYYDALNARLQAADIPYYGKVIPQEARTICELACGTGRILLTLARQDRSLTGVDNSPEMLAIAREKARGLPGDIRFYREDMCRMGRHGPFEVVLCGYNSLQHICDDRDLRGFFAGVRENLAEGGALLLDLFQPDPVYLFPEGNQRPLVRLPREDGSTLGVTERTLYHPETRINQITYLYDRDGEFLFQEEYRMKEYEAAFLDPFVEDCGFLVEEKYGDYDLSPFTDRSPKQLYILRAR